MAPELLFPDEDSSLPTKASDIYAWAMVAFEVSNGQLQMMTLVRLWDLFSFFPEDYHFMISEIPLLSSRYGKERGQKGRWMLRI
jgi:hypothetical protein